ncbi:MAG: anaerobic glycerol-3-phosphate dehydrogenase subunit B, partial [Bilophila sp.]
MPESTLPSHDVIVAGGGLSGLAAAVFAARAGKRTLLITRGSGVLAIGGGSIDVLGYRPDGTPLTAPFDGFDSLPPRHPYRLVGEQTVRRALNAFVRLSEEAGFPYQHSGDTNTRIATGLGTTKPSFLVPPTLSMRGIASAQTVLVAGVAQLKDFSPLLIAQGLSARQTFAGKTLVPVSLPCPFSLQRDLSTLDLARYLDTPDGLHWLISSLKSALPAQATRQTHAVLLPPLLGTTADARVHAAVVAATVSVSEVVTLPPAITGLRLHAMLLRLLKKYHVDLIEQASVTGAVIENRHCTALITTNDGRERRYAGRTHIIATGGILSEGFLTTPERAWEPIFNLELPLNPSSPGWSLPLAYPACAPLG